MVKQPVAYVVLGSYVHPGCARSIQMSRRVPVYANEMPQPVYCRKCEDPILVEPCVFCDILAGTMPVEWVLRPDFWPETMAFVPLNPVVEGHCLIAPKDHVTDFAADPQVFGVTARRAGELMRWTDRPMNVITSKGREATQSVFHLHLHLIPRSENDGLALPWYSGRRRKEKW